jgi:hypothetical protein
VIKTVDLYAPAGFVAASPEVRDYVANGCGPAAWKHKIISDVIWGLDIRICCDIHDWMYADGDTIADKDAADRTFLNNMLRMVDAAGGPGWLQMLRRRRAKTYYEAVCLFGGAPFWDGKNLAGELFPAFVRCAA